MHIREVIVNFTTRFIVYEGDKPLTEPLHYDQAVAYVGSRNVQHGVSDGSI